MPDFTPEEIKDRKHYIIGKVIDAQKSLINDKRYYWDKSGDDVDAAAESLMLAQTAFSESNATEDRVKERYKAWLKTKEFA